jgi:hypothetical protein
VLDTLVDLNRQVVAATLQADAQLPSGSSFGGLRGGFARLTGKAAILENFSFVPGVQLNATFPVRGGRLQAADISVSGSAASAGMVRFGGATTRITGTLSGRRFDIDVAKVRLASTAGGEWPGLATLARALPGLALARGAGLP